MSAQPKADPSPAQRPAVSLPKLLDMKRAGEKIVMLTSYDASFAALSDQQGVDVLLIGDSLGMVISGYSSTLPVTMDEIAYHTRAVARGNKSAWVVADMPFASYHENPQQAYTHAARLLACGANMVKLEGGEWLIPTVEFLTQRDIPVCAHLGLTPQSVNALGGYKVQAKTKDDAERLKRDALALQSAGARLLVLEAIPRLVGAEVSAALDIPTIGIGAGPECDGQVLVLHDMLSVYPGRKARFVKNFMEGAPSIADAIRNYVQAVKTGSFPGPEHCF